MWDLLFFDIVFLLVVIIAPGYLLARSIGLDKDICLCLSPLISLGFIYVFAFALRLACIKSSWAGIVLPVLAVSLIAFLVAHRKRILVSGNLVTGRLKICLLACLVTSLVAFCFYVLPLDTAASFYQENDNIAHLSTVRQFLDMGYFAGDSILGYPNLWRTFAALAASCGQQNVCVAANAANLLTICFIFPAGFGSLIDRIVDSSSIRVCAACLVPAFAVFPWGLCIFGPLYPNIIGFSLLPSVMLVFISMFDADSVRSFILRCLAFLASALVLVFAHPSSIFTGVVFLVPYAIWRIGGILKEKGYSLPKTVFFQLLFACFVLVFWLLMYKSSFMAGVVSFDWPPYLTHVQAAANVLMLSLTKTAAPQWVLAVLVLIGFGISWVIPSYRWLAVSHLLFSIIYVADTSVSGSLQHLFAGFWYCDSFRVASNLIFTGVFLAGLGCSLVYSWLKTAVGIFGKELSAPIAHFDTRTGAILTATVVALIFVPNFEIPKNCFSNTGFGQVQDMMISHNSLQPKSNGLDSKEIDFINEAHAITGSAKVLNYPYDGSAYAYAVSNLNVVNRGWYKHGREDIARFCSGYLSSNDASQLESIKADGIHYILLLDNTFGFDSGGYYFGGGYNQSDWAGIESIDDSDSNFEIVLADGSMRLYRIVG